MDTKGLQDKQDELQGFVIGPKPLVLADETESQTVLLAVESDLQGGVEATAQSVTAREAEAVALVLLLEPYRLGHDFVE